MSDLTDLAKEVQRLRTEIGALKESISTRHLVVRDNEGNPRIRLTAEDGGPRFDVLAPGGEPRITLAVDEEGLNSELALRSGMEPIEISLLQGPNESTIGVFHKETNARLFLQLASVADVAQPLMVAWDSAGQERILLTAIPNEAVSLMFKDKREEPRLEIGQAEVPFFTVRDEKGVTRCQLYVMPNGAPGVILADAAGAMRTTLDVDTDGCPRIIMNASDGTPRLVAIVSEDNTAHLLTLDGKGETTQIF